jgi:hypothetical protein
MNTRGKVMALAAVPAAALAIGGSVALAQTSTTPASRPVSTVTSGYGMGMTQQHPQLHYGAWDHRVPTQTHEATHTAAHPSTTPTQTAAHHPVTVTMPGTMTTHHPVTPTATVPMPMHHGTATAQPGAPVTSAPMPMSGAGYGNSGGSGYPMGSMHGTTGHPGLMH